jgi:hypothetical protein
MRQINNSFWGMEQVLFPFPKTFLVQPWSRKSAAISTFFKEYTIINFCLRFTVK